MESEMYTQQQWIGSCDSNFIPKIVQRRAKRSIPDNDKDDKYWEKRKRNNMAAKRSRECKRQAESDVRNKVSFLEEENALLRKEISLMKAKFGIPPDQSMLSQDERAQCMHDVRSNRQLTDNGGKSESEDGSDNSMMSPIGARYSLAGMAKSVSPYDRMNDEVRRQHEQARLRGSDMNINGYEVYASWNQVPPENAYMNAPMYQNGEPKYPCVTPPDMMDKHALYSQYERYMAEDGGSSVPRAGYQYYGYQSQPLYPGNTSVPTPADLTLNRKQDENSTSDECVKKEEANPSPLKLPVKHEYYNDVKRMMLKHASHMADSTTNRSDLSSSSQDEDYYGSPVNADPELKTKLQQLSSQYNELKK